MLIISGRRVLRTVGLITLIGVVLMVSGCMITFPTSPPSATVVRWGMSAQVEIQTTE